jgi:hypothetical protein
MANEFLFSQETKPLMPMIALILEAIPEAEYG